MESDMAGGGLSERRSLVYNIDTNFGNLFMKYVERVGVERKKRLAFLLAALLLPEAVFAAAGGNDLAMGNAVEYRYSSHITGPISQAIAGCMMRRRSISMMASAG